jgi:uncharacterized membrane protein YbhN (UPF0104 family)
MPICSCEELKLHSSCLNNYLEETRAIPYCEECEMYILLEPIYRSTRWNKIIDPMTSAIILFVILGIIIPLICVLVIFYYNLIENNFWYILTWIMFLVFLCLYDIALFFWFVMRYRELKKRLQKIVTFHMG